MEVDRPPAVLGTGQEHGAPAVLVGGEVRLSSLVGVAHREEPPHEGEREQERGEA
jgi:hypothetical protein